ncbi:MAG TPA: tetratricopeptide repeat protein [Xanthomonadales bacterium]
MSFFSELKRRNVFKVAAAYLIVAWLLLQISDTLVPALHLPEWFNSGVAFLLIIGFPIAIIFAWAFEMTPEGLKKEKDIDRSQSVTAHTGKRLNTTILLLMAMAIAYLLFDKFSGTRPDSSSTPATEVAHSVVQQNPEPAPVAVATDTRQSIAVLPFANRSNVEDDLFFTDGIHDDLLTQLAKIDGLKVISRTSVMEYRGTTKKIPQIAAELGVATILEGGIQRAGNRVRINAQLIDVAHDEHLWAETYDREMTIENLFDIQSDITRAIVAAVKLELSDEQVQALADAPTANLEAYEAYLRARAAINRADYVADKFFDALPWAEQAVELDPGFTEGWAILTEVHGQLYWIGADPTEERKARAADALAKTLQTGPGTAPAHAAQALWHYRFDRDFAAALNEYVNALALRPGDTAWMVYKALSQRRLGDWDGAIVTFEQILAIDPVNVWAMAQMASTYSFMQDWATLSRRLDDWVLRFPDSDDLRSERFWTYMNLGQMDQALNMVRSSLDGEGPLSMDAITVLIWNRDFPRVIELLESRQVQTAANMGDIVRARTLGFTYARLGQAETSRSYYRQAVELIATRKSSSTRNEALRLRVLAETYAEMGEMEQARAAIEQAVAYSPLAQDYMDGSIVEKGLIYVTAITGDRDEALRLIESKLDGPGGFSRGELRLDPRWDFFRDDERFNTLIESGGVK